MAQADGPVAADGVSLTVESQRVGSAKEVVVREHATEPVPVREAAFQTRLGVDAESEDVLVPRGERGKLAVTQARVEHRGNLVYRLDFDPHAAPGVGNCAHVRGREVWLRAQEPLRFSSPKLGAWSADLERYEPADDRFSCRRMVEAEAARDLAPDAHVSPEWWPLGSDDDGADGVAIARHSRHRVGGR
jgi:hypothetical protein